MHFVDLLIENGASLNKITYDHLNHLYNTNVFIFFMEELGKIIDFIQKEDLIIPKRKSNKYFFNLRDDFYQNYFQEKNSLVNFFSNGIFTFSIVQIGEAICSPENNFTLEQNAANRLFIWAISVNRINLAKYLSSKIWV